MKIKSEPFDSVAAIQACEESADYLTCTIDISLDHIWVSLYHSSR